MQDTKRERGSAPTAALLSAVADELRRLAAEAETAMVIRFGELFLADATAEFFAERTPATVAALVMSAFRHMQRSAPDRADVAVGAPEQEQEPWSAPVTLIRAHATEAPFIVSTIREYLHEQHLSVERFLHPVLRVVRAGDGSVQSIGPASA
ncbi:MAG: NAD-glutamate dehydrogenase, partial [Gemmatimonadetes bacterium]|nr:NAD-glutamate dehydrogenase [Gemmatimonadota bacterium]